MELTEEKARDNNNNDDHPIFHQQKFYYRKKDLPKYDINNSNDKGELKMGSLNVLTFLWVDEAGRKLWIKD